MKLIPLTQGKFAKVSDRDFKMLNQYKWSAQNPRNTWYASRNLPPKKNRKTLLMHNAILGLSSKTKVDHRDGDGLNNQRHNLRRATNSQNIANSRLNSKNTSGYKGVTWDKERNRWIAQITVLYVHIQLGRFTELTDAAKAYDRAAKKHFGKFARLNFPL